VHVSTGMTSSIRRAAALVAASFVTSVAACSSFGPQDPPDAKAPPDPRAPAELQAPTNIDPGSPPATAISSPASCTEAGVPDYKACRTDTDCVAVASAECCANGRMEAVNSDDVDAYRRSAGCTDKHVICTMILFIDHRVAECDGNTHACTMVEIDSIACGGLVAVPHACPDGFTCDFAGRQPDVPGKCVARP
jgi:hypothetical protein